MTPPNHIQQLHTAKERLEILATGRDPDTGKPLAISNATITALQIAVQSIDLTNTTLAYAAQKLKKDPVFLSLLQQPLRPPNKPSSAPQPLPAPMHGQPWDPQQDTRLLADFAAGIPLPTLATRYARTVTAVSMRLVHLGAIPPTATTNPSPNTTANSTPKTDV